KLCHNHSSFATFTASSKVRKALQKYGFKVKKDKGFGNKREMMLQNKQYFRICETGFGSGLNFILTKNLWHKYVINDSQLEFISF
ncbi:hypothetical protein IDZ82_09505, partial [Francisella tularensis subsp. holarctica]|uniref:MnmC family methyltransferase n=1 Tax=Francisella tularensis TaxID=263 RepID=UPI0019989101